MKQSLAGVMTGLQGLGWDESREKPVDRLTALGNIQAATVNRAINTAHMCSLGVDLLAFKFAHRVPSRIAAEEKLAISLRDKRDRRLITGSDAELHRVAAWAIHEWAVDLCPSCLGAREVPDHDCRGLEGNQPMKPCPTCHGTGRRRYTDEERMQAMGGTFDRSMYTAHDLIAQAEALAVDMAKRVLDRW